MPRFLNDHVSRRDFLTLSGRTMLTSMLLGIGITGGALPVLQSKVWGASQSSVIQSTSTSEEKVVVIFLRGAMDGLSALVPYGDPNYYRLRPRIAIPQPEKPNGAIHLSEGFGMHPAFEKLMPYWNSGALRFVRSFGLNNATRSHFDAQSFMESGVTDGTLMSSGWLNRLANELPNSEKSKFAMNFGKTTPLIFSGDSTVSSYGLGKNSEKRLPVDNPVIKEAFAGLYDGTDPLSLSYQEGIAVRDSLKETLSKEQVRANNGAALPSGFPEAGAKIGKLLRMEPDIRLAFMDIGGWDTHTNQTGQLTRHFSHLALGLERMISEMKPEVFKKTTILVFSEFGRTAKENGNQGTDHGHGNIMMMLRGQKAAKQIQGSWYGLSQSGLHQNRDIPVLNDYRSVIGGVLAGTLKLNPQQLNRIFPDIPSDYRNFTSLV